MQTVALKFSSEDKATRQQTNMPSSHSTLKARKPKKKRYGCATRMERNRSVQLSMATLLSSSGAEGISLISSTPYLKQTSLISQPAASVSINAKKSMTSGITSTFLMHRQRTMHLSLQFCEVPPSVSLTLNSTKFHYKQEKVSGIKHRITKDLPTISARQ